MKMKMDSVLLLLSLCALNHAATLHASDPSCPARRPAEERTRTCPRPCSGEKECVSKRQCLCDGECGRSCVAPGRSCPWPLPPSDSSSFILTSPTPSFSSLMEVRCKDGYLLPSGLNVIIRRCQGDRKWSGEEVECIAVAPPLPPSDTNTTATLTAPAILSCPLTSDLTAKFNILGDASVGNTVQYSCLGGERLVGTQQNVCQEDQTWRFPHPDCVLASCPTPPEVKNGHVVAIQKTSYDPGFNIYFLCKKGFMMDGSQEITCLPNGSWSKAPPHCRASCVIPANRSRVMVRGEMKRRDEFTDSKVRHNTEVTFFCRHPTLRCKLNETVTCNDGRLDLPSCYQESTWIRYNLFNKYVTSELAPCWTLIQPTTEAPPTPTHSAPLRPFSSNLTTPTSQ